MRRRHLRIGGAVPFCSTVQLLAVVFLFVFTCYETQNRRFVLTLKWFIARDFVANWDDMEKTRHHNFFYVLEVVPEVHPVFLTEALVNIKTVGKYMTQVMFEMFNVLATSVAIRVVPSLFENSAKVQFVRCQLTCLCDHC